MSHLRQFEEEAMEEVKDLFLLDGLSQEDKEKIISYLAPPIKFSKYEVIYSADDFTTSLGLICKGKAFAVTNNGQGAFMKSFCSGEVFGAAAIFGNGQKYVSSVIAKTDIEVLFIEEEILRKIFLLYPKTAINYITFLSDKVRFLNKKLSLLSSPNAEDTLLNYLNSVKDNDGYAYIPENMTIFSKMLGIGRATLYRSFEKLEKSGKIKRENNIVKVINYEKNC